MLVIVINAKEAAIYALQKAKKNEFIFRQRHLGLYRSETNLIDTCFTVKYKEYVKH